MKPSCDTTSWRWKLKCWQWKVQDHLLPDFNRIETHLKIGAGVVIFVFLIIKTYIDRSDKQTDRQELQAVKQELQQVKKSFQQHEKEKAQEFKEIEQKIEFILEMDRVKAQEMTRLKDRIEKRRTKEESVIKAIDTMDNQQIVEFFRQVPQ